MNLISDIIELKNLQSAVESWLDTVVYMNTDWQDVTNRMIMNLLEEKPEGWFNPFEMTVEELDELRTNFKGAAIDWERFIQDKIPFLDSKVERGLKLTENIKRDVLMCGKKRLRVDRKTGKLEEYTAFCGRCDLCVKCCIRKEKEMMNRFEKMEEYQFLEIEPEARKNWIKELGKEKVYFQPLASGKVLMVADGEIGGELFTHDEAKKYAKVPPKGAKCSGNLGKSTPVVKQTTNNEEPTETIYQATFTVDATEEAMRKINEEYKAQTIHIIPRKLSELQGCIYKCEKILEEILKKYCTKIHNTKRTKTVMTENDFDWTWKEKEENAPAQQTASG